MQQIFSTNKKKGFYFSLKPKDNMSVSSPSDTKLLLLLALMDFCRFPRLSSHFEYCYANRFGLLERSIWEVTNSYEITRLSYATYLWDTASAQHMVFVRTRCQNRNWIVQTFPCVIYSYCVCLSYTLFDQESRPLTRSYGLGGGGGSQVTGKSKEPKSPVVVMCVCTLDI